MPSRYEPAGGGAVARHYAKLRAAAVPWFWSQVTGLAETAVFGRYAGGVRRLLRLSGRSLLRTVGPQFDAAFYVRQFGDGLRRRRLERDPLLHFVLIGVREGRSPLARFDPAFVKHRHPSLRSGLDRLLASLTGEADRPPLNEVELDAQSTAWRPGRPAVLCLHHARGGGSTEFLAAYERQLRSTGRNVLRLRAVPLAPGLGVVEDHAAGDAVTRVFDLARERRQLAGFAQSRGVERLVVNHLVDRPVQALEWVRDLSAHLQCPYEVILHDYFVLCPRIDLIDGQGRFCGVAPVEQCVRCVAAHGAEAEDADPETWRRDFLGFVRGADKVVAPSSDLASRLQPYLPSTAITVWEPQRDDGLPPELPPRLRPDEPLRVATLGALTVPKGLRVVQALAEQAASDGSPIRLEVLGPSSEALRGPGVRVSGAYRPGALDALIAGVRPHLVFLPAIWPETWSFVLTAALERGLPVVAFDIGAPAQRLRRLGRGHLLPIALAGRPVELLAAFTELRQRWIVQ